MSSEGILARGKFNYEAKRDLDNPETLAYIATLSKEEKPKEAKKNAKRQQ